MTQLRIPAVFMRGGTSKGVFFRGEVLPADPAARDRLLLRVLGSPDPYGKQIDGMGGATSSTSKVVIVTKSKRPDCDVDYLFGAVAIDAPIIDWSGNCGNLVSAVGPFAIGEGLVAPKADGLALVRIWQVNTAKKILAHVPVRQGAVIETGGFQLDGVAFPGAEIKLEFLDPGGADDGEGGAMFPTGRTLDVLQVPAIGPVNATLINAGNPMVFVEAKDLGLVGTELQFDVNSRRELLDRCEAIRAQGAVAMGLAASAAEATAKRPATPKLALVGAPLAFTAAGGKKVAATDIDLNVRTLSMGQLHHAIPGTSAIAVAVAASIPGTLVQQVLGRRQAAAEIRIGHPSGITASGAETGRRQGEWLVTRATISRSARRLMEGWVIVPAEGIEATAGDGDSIAQFLD
jgi:2-methylaconitate isomerase